MILRQKVITVLTLLNEVTQLANKAFTRGIQNTNVIFFSKMLIKGLTALAGQIFVLFCADIYTTFLHARTCAHTCVTNTLVRNCAVL